MNEIVYLNTSQLCRRLDCANQTIRARLAAGLIVPDASDAKGNLLFLESRLEQIRAALTPVQHLHGEVVA